MTDFLNEFEDSSGDELFKPDYKLKKTLINGNETNLQ
jgi:hypothetical protein